MANPQEITGTAVQPANGVVNALNARRENRNVQGLASVNHRVASSPNDVGAGYVQVTR